MMRRDRRGWIMIDDQWRAPDAAGLRWSTASVVPGWLPSDFGRIKVPFGTAVRPHAVPFLNLGLIGFL
jgi:hypothetical protein